MKTAGVCVLSFLVSLTAGELSAAQRISAQALPRTPARNAAVDTRRPKPLPKLAPPASSHYALLPTAMPLYAAFRR